MGITFQGALKLWKKPSFGENKKKKNYMDNSLANNNFCLVGSSYKEHIAFFCQETVRGIPKNPNGLFSSSSDFSKNFFTENRKGPNWEQLAYLLFVTLLNVKVLVLYIYTKDKIFFVQFVSFSIWVSFSFVIYPNAEISKWTTTKLMSQF